MELRACGVAEFHLFPRLLRYRAQVPTHFFMAALGSDQVLNLAQQYGAVGAAQPAALAVARQRGRRPGGIGLGRHNRARGAEARQRGARWARKQRQLVLQS